MKSDISFYNEMMKSICTHKDSGKRNPVDIGVECGYSEEEVMKLLQSFSQNDFVAENKNVLTNNESAPIVGNRKSIKSTVFMQFAGRECNVDHIMDQAEADWCEKGNRRTGINTIELYLKPEESAAYYIVNEIEAGKIII